MLIGREGEEEGERVGRVGKETRGRRREKKRVRERRRRRRTHHPTPVKTGSTSAYSRWKEKV